MYLPKSDETRGSEVTELPGGRGYVYCPYIPNFKTVVVGKDGPVTGTEFEAREGYRSRIDESKTNQ